MRRTSAGLIVGLVALNALACSSKKEDPAAVTSAAIQAVAAQIASAQLAAAQAAAVAAAAASGANAAAAAGGDALTAPVSFGAPAAVVVEPPIKLKQSEGGDHAKTVGWSKDSTELAVCSEGAGMGALECQFLKPGGKVEKVSGFDPANGVDADKTAKLKARLASKGYGAAEKEWPYASEMVLTWVSTREEANGTCRLRSGAKVNGAASASYPAYVETKGALGMHAESLSISPNGKWIGLVTHSSSGEGTDKFELRALAVTSVVAQTFNDAGFAHHKKGEYSESAALFHKAAAVEPQSKLATYNYACALGRLKHAGTEAALKTAIEVGGDAVKKRAAKDADLAAVATEPWFLTLTQ